MEAHSTKKANSCLKHIKVIKNVSQFERNLAVKNTPNKKFPPHGHPNVYMLCVAHETLLFPVSADDDPRGTP